MSDANAKKEEEILKLKREKEQLEQIAILEDMRKAAEES